MEPFPTQLQFHLYHQGEPNYTCSGVCSLQGLRRTSSSSNSRSSRFTTCATRPCRMASVPQQFAERIVAQNGPTELKGNLMQSCAWHHIQNQDFIIDTLYCIENTHFPIDNNPMNLLSDWGKNDIHMSSDRIRVPGVPAVSCMMMQVSFCFFNQTAMTRQNFSM